MKIGELAKLAACPVETVRYYEREGLLPPALRQQSNNYRRYSQAHLERLVFIRRCRSLDMTHDEIRALLEARQQPDASCAGINALIDAHLHHVQARVVELQALAAQLVELRSQCQAELSTRECGILHELEQPGEPVVASAARAETHLAGVHSRGDSHARCTGCNADAPPPKAH